MEIDTARAGQCYLMEISTKVAIVEACAMERDSTSSKMAHVTKGNGGST